MQYTIYVSYVPYIGGLDAGLSGCGSFGPLSAWQGQP